MATIMLKFRTDDYVMQINRLLGSYKASGTMGKYN
jgi:hypothetical protein